VFRRTRLPSTTPQPAARRSCRGSRWRPAALLLPLVVSAAALPFVVATSAPAQAATTQVTPFVMPSTATLRAAARKVFINWAPTLTISLDNKPADQDYYTKEYQDPDGSGGANKAWGGYARDRPLPRSVLTGDWRMQDLEAEVRQAISVGVDGFSTCLFTVGGTGQSWKNNVMMMQAAINVDPGFKIILQPDMSGSIKAKTAAELAQYMNQLGSYSSAYKLADGRLVISPFNAESHDATWWSSFLSIMKNTYGKPVAFLPLFQDEQKYRDSFAPISYGMSNWGNRNPAWNDPTTTTATSPSGRIKKIHDLGKIWMQPASSQDERPREGRFQESNNTENLRKTWQLAIQNNAEMVQINTWNDLPEGSNMDPSQHNGWSYMDICSYYLVLFKTGKAPAITKDGTIVTHRIQPWQNKPSYPQTKLMTFPTTGGGTAPRDMIEALAFMTAPGTVTITAGGVAASCSAPAGLSVCTVPLHVGSVSITTTRSGITTSSLTSPHRIVTTPYVQDLHYFGATSVRQGTSSGTSPAPSPTPSPTASPTPTPTTPPTGSTTTVVASSDAGPDSTRPDTLTGADNFVTSRGGKDAMTYLRFVLPAAPAGKSLTGAKLVLRTTSDASSASAATHQVRTGSDAWTESQLTWANHPVVTGTALGTVPASSANSTVTVPLTVSAVQALLGSQSTITIGSTGTDAVYVWSREAATASNRPALVLTFG
jgi:hypothetical protein